MLYDKINNDMVSFMKSHNKEALSTIRLLKSEIDAYKINNKLEKISDEIIINICSHQVKVHKESIDLFDKAGRSDLSDPLRKEIDLIKTYLPEELSKEEIITIVDSIFNKVKPTSKKDIGLLMKEANILLKGKADFKLVSEIIQNKLNF
ncbi:MAG: GatB/YqeY domain-containing protein [Bacilli bacterium]